MPGDGLGEVNANRLRYAATTGRVLTPLGRAPVSRPSGPCRRRPSTRWRRTPRARASIPARLRPGNGRRLCPVGRGSDPQVAAPPSRRSPASLTAVRTPVGDGWILSPVHEPSFRGSGGPAARRGSCRAGTRNYLLQEQVIENCWSLDRIAGRTSGPCGSGPAPSWWTATSSGPGDGRRPADRRSASWRRSRPRSASRSKRKVRHSGCGISRKAFRVRWGDRL